MKKPNNIIGPDGRNLVLVQQLSVGDITRAGDWFLAIDHRRCDWYSAEPNLTIKEFHKPHVRILTNTNPQP